MWFLTQHKRWGLIKDHPDYLAVAKQINQIDIYKQAAAATKTSVPKELLRCSKLVDGTCLGRQGPEEVRRLFKVRADRSLRRHHGQCRFHSRSSAARPRAAAAAAAVASSRRRPHRAVPASGTRAALRLARLWLRCCRRSSARACWSASGHRAHETGSGFPTPAETFKQAVDVFSDPFYRKGPNDQGIGWNVLLSLSAWPRLRPGGAVGIPLGFMIGRFTFLSRMFNR
jgi:hypothetical protein